MKTTKFFCAGLAIAGAALGMTSCHDHDEMCSDGGKANGTTTNSELTADALHRLLYNVTDIDTLPANWASSSYAEEATVGEVIDQSNPHVRYVSAASTQEAVDFYQMITGQTADSYTTTWTHDSIGTVSLNTDSTATCYGKITLAVKQLPGIEEIRFVPLSAMGQNKAEVWEPHYHFGDVIEIQNDKTQEKELWICIRGEYCNEKVHKEYSYWASFTVPKKNTKTATEKGSQYSYPCDLGGNDFYQCTLPQLLAIISDPTRAWKAWLEYREAYKNQKYVDPRYEGYGFQHAPFAFSDYLENDFNAISSAVRSGLNMDLTKLIPSWKTTQETVDGESIALITHGPKTPLVGTFPLTFNNCIEYSGNFFTQEKKLSFTYNTTDDYTPMTVDKIVNGYSIFNGKISAATKGNTNGYVLARIKSSEKMKEISNKKNKGSKFVGAKGYTITDVVRVPYKDAHEALSFFVPYNATLCVGDVVEGKNQTRGVCMARTGKTTWIASPTDDAVTQGEVTENVAFNMLFNYLNCALDRDYWLTYIDDANESASIYKNLVVAKDVWNTYNQALLSLGTYANLHLEQLNLAHYAASTNIIGTMFNYNKQNYSVSAPCWKKNAEGAKVYEVMTLSYNTTTHKFNLQVEEQNAENPTKFYYNVSSYTDDNNSYYTFTRLHSTGSDMKNRKEIVDLYTGGFIEQKLKNSQTFVTGVKVSGLYSE